MDERRHFLISNNLIQKSLNQYKVKLGQDTAPPVGIIESFINLFDNILSVWSVNSQHVIKCRYLTGWFRHVTRMQFGDWLTGAKNTSYRWLELVLWVLLPPTSGTWRMSRYQKNLHHFTSSKSNKPFDLIRLMGGYRLCICSYCTERVALNIRE